MSTYLAVFPQIREILTAAKSQMALHDAMIIKPASLGFPVDFLDVIAHLHGQGLTALGPASFQDFASVTSLHALAEAMNTNTTALLGLVCTFWHLRPLSKNALGARCQVRQ